MGQDEPIIHPAASPHLDEYVGLDAHLVPAVSVTAAAAGFAHGHPGPRYVERPQTGQLAGNAAGRNLAAKARLQRDCA